MEVINLLRYAKAGEITAFIGDIDLENNNNLKIFPNNILENKNVKEKLSNLYSTEKLFKALKVMDLTENDLNSNYLTVSLINKFALVEALLSKEQVLIFINIHKCLTYREICNVKRVLKKLAEHNKTVIVLTNDIEFLFNLTKKVIGIKNEETAKEFFPVNWFDKEIYNYVSKSPIIEFVDYCRSRNIKIEDSIETKELLKAIYRSVDK